MLHPIMISVTAFKLYYNFVPNITLEVDLLAIIENMHKHNGLQIERSRVTVPLAAEIYFSSGCTQPYPKN